MASSPIKSGDTRRDTQISLDLSLLKLRPKKPVARAPFTSPVVRSQENKNPQARSSAVSLPSTSLSQSELVLSEKLAFITSYNQHLEELLYQLSSSFTSYVDQVQENAPILAKHLGFYTVEFNEGFMGLVLELNPELDKVLVATIHQFNAAGEESIASSCRKIRIGDELIAINGLHVNMYGSPDLSQIANTFRHELRPLTVLFRSASS
jgi:hypothetical protein